MFAVCALGVLVGEAGWAQGPPQDEQIASWIARLGEGVPGDNNTATAALIEIGKPAIPYLREVLGTEPSPFRDRTLTDEHWVRLRAAHCLSMLAVPDAASILEREIERDPHPGMRLIYAIYLTRHDISKSVEALVADLARAEYTVPDLLITLRNINNRHAIPLLEPLLNDSPPEVQVGVAELLMSLGSESGVPMLLSQLDNPESRLRAALVLPARYGDLVLPILKDSLDGAASDARLQIAERLADMGQSEGFEVLLDALERESDPGRRGSDGPLHESPGISDRIIAMIGRPDTYDPSGTARHRDAVVARWRRRYQAEGEAFLEGLRTLPGIEGRQDASLGDIHLSRDMSNMRTTFFLPGRKIYELGTMDGRFPPMARLLGDQGGVWAHPVKVLDGFQFDVVEPGKPEWPLTDSRHFSHRFYAAEFHYARQGLEATREDFAAEDEPVLFTQLTLRDKTGHARELHVRFIAWVNIRPAWRSGLPNDIDEIRVEDGVAMAVDAGNELGRVVFGADRIPTAYAVEDNVVTLTYTLRIPADGEATIPFAVVVGTDEPDRLKHAMASKDALLAAKASAYSEAAFGGVRFESSDRRVTEAFQLAKLNLHMMTADLRPHMPAPYFFAGIPYYTQLFGCDNTLSLPGAVAGGFTETAKGTLECLADNARKQNGRSPHEVATSNRHVGDGNAQEPPQFVVACQQYYLWTGDREFLREVYPTCRQVIDYCRARRDEDGYIQGPALIESHGMGPEKLDAAAYLIAAYAAVSAMASELGETSQAEEYAAFAEESRARFDGDWWMPEHGIWADSRVPGGERRMTDYWSVVFPILAGVAEPGRVQPALDEIERGWINQWGGVHTRGDDISGQGSGVVTTNLFAQAAFQHGRADLGWSQVRKASRAPLEERMLGGFNEVIPPGGSDILQLWSAAPLLGAVIEGLAGIRPDAGAHRVELAPRAPTDLDFYSLEGVTVGGHELSLAFRQGAGERIVQVAHTAGDVPLLCVFRAVVEPGEVVLLNGAEVDVTPTASLTLGREEVALEFTLEPQEGARIVVGRLASGRP
jgi:HEAT repeat protein